MKTDNLVTSRMIVLEHPTFLDALLLHYIGGKGWLFEFWHGKAYGDPRRFFVTKTKVMEGIFSVMGCIENLNGDEFFKSDEERMIRYVFNFRESNFKEMIEKSFVPSKYGTDARKLIIDPFEKLKK